MWRCLFRICISATASVWYVFCRLARRPTRPDSEELAKEDYAQNMTKSETRARTCGQGSSKAMWSFHANEVPGGNKQQHFELSVLDDFPPMGQESAETKLRCKAAHAPMGQQSQPCSSRVDKTTSWENYREKILTMLLPTEAPDAGAKYLMKCWRKSGSAQ